MDDQVTEKPMQSSWISQWVVQGQARDLFGLEEGGLRHCRGDDSTGLHYIRQNDPLVHGPREYARHTRLYNNHYLSLQTPRTIHLPSTTPQDPSPISAMTRMKNIYLVQPNKTIYVLLLVSSTNLPPVMHKIRPLQIAQITVLLLTFLPKTINIQPFL